MLRGVVVVFLLTAVLLVSGCGTTYPADPRGTLETVRSGTLRVGASQNGDWVQITVQGNSSDADAVQGTEADLVRRFAQTLDAEVEWVPGTEQVLAEELKHGGLDLVIGGLDDTTPWSTHAGLTRPYAESRDSRGSLRRHIMLVPMGENAFLLELDRFLKSAAGPA